jgi:hypothetical protein
LSGVESSAVWRAGKQVIEEARKTGNEEEGKKEH